MRLRTRQEIAEEFRMPLGGVDARMKSLGCAPFRHATKGRGYHVLYDADEVVRALENERETALAKVQKRRPKVKPAPDDFYCMGWSKAKLLLTGGLRSQ